MAKSFLSLAKARKSTFEFSGKPVKESDLQKILEAGRWAPSSLNSQPWRFVVVKNPQAIDSIVASAYYGIFHAEPPLIIAIVLPREFHKGEPHRGVKKGRLGTKEAMLSIGMPALMMSLAAEDLGLASCILTLDEARIDGALGLRSGDFVPIAVGIGYPDKKARSHGITHKRRALSSLVKKEKFRAD